MKVVTADQILVFTLDELSYALPLSIVVRVMHSKEIRHLPKAGEVISGNIKIKGQIIPVADIRKRFGLMEHEIDPDDRLIIADTGKRQVAILVDSVTGVRDLATRQFNNSKERLSYAEYIWGVANVENELILIYNLEQFLSLDEEKILEHAEMTI